MERTTYVIALAALLALSCAPGRSSDAGPAVEDPGEHACEVFGDPGIRMVATATPETAPMLAPTETPYTIELLDAAPGFVALDGEVDALLFVEHENVVTGVFHEQNLDFDLLPTGTANEFCDSMIPEHFDLELDASGSYFLRLGPSALDEVWLVFIGAAEHAHGGE